jgi:hypothetical protein
VITPTQPLNTHRHEARSGVPRLALSKTEAAHTLGVSVDYFEDHIQPELRIIYRGRRRLIPVRELERWLDENATRTLTSNGARP